MDEIQIFFLGNSKKGFKNVTVRLRIAVCEFAEIQGSKWEGLKEQFLHSCREHQGTASSGQKLPQQPFNNQTQMIFKMLQHVLNPGEV